MCSVFAWATVLVYVYWFSVNQTAVIRWDYGNVQLGTCEETLEGGDHIRYWVQNGPQENTGAIFMALSYEMPIAGTLLGWSPSTSLSQIISHRSTQHNRKRVGFCNIVHDSESFR